MIIDEIMDLVRQMTEEDLIAFRNEILTRLHNREAANNLPEEEHEEE